MEKHQISDTFYYVETKNPENQLLRTVVFRLENDIYEAFTSYFLNGSIVGFATSDNDAQDKDLSELKPHGYYCVY